MKPRNVAILIFILILLDQILKVWIKTNMSLNEAFIIFPDWFQIRFVENNGAAFGMQIANSGGFDWGKMALSLFRVILISAGCVYVYKLIKKGTHKMIIIPMAMIIAGAVGNMIDSAFYGMIFSESTYNTVATVGEGYGHFMMGKVVDMFYFPLFQWNSVPSFLSFLVDSNNYFFGAIFNLADSYISVAMVILIIFSFTHKDLFKEL